MKLLQKPFFFPSICSEQVSDDTDLKGGKRSKWPQKKESLTACYDAQASWAMEGMQ